MISGATFSACKRYRYTLTRIWDDAKPLAVFCGLNPSTADESNDDPTIRREIGFARDWGMGGLVKVNAYAWRSTDPKALWQVDDPIGEQNFPTITHWGKRAALFVAAWGANIQPGHAWKLRLLLTVASIQPYALKLTKNGHPAHPLYLPKTLRPRQWLAARAGFGVSGQLGREWTAKQLLAEAVAQ